MYRFQKFLQWLKDLYRRQPEIFVAKPLRRHNPEPQKFEMKGVILDSAKDPRIISHSGSSPHINIPADWKDELDPPLQLHLYQTDKRGIIIEEIGGETTQ
jgi:hypothetical protein